MTRQYRDLEKIMPAVKVYVRPGIVADGTGEDAKLISGDELLGVKTADLLLGIEGLVDIHPDHA